MLKPPKKTSRRTMRITAGLLALLAAFAVFCGYEDIKRLFPDFFSATAPDGTPLPDSRNSSSFQNQQEERIQNIEKNVTNKHFAKQLEKQAAGAVEEKRYLEYRDLRLEYSLVALPVVIVLFLIWKKKRSRSKPE